MINLDSLVERLFTQNQLVKGVLSSPLKKQEILKIVIKPVRIRDKIYFQWTSHSKTQAFHKNYGLEESILTFKEEVQNYKQSIWHTLNHQYHVLNNNKGQTKIIRKEVETALPLLNHNKEKNYLLKEGEPIPYLVELGIMSAQGKVLPAKNDKFRQINRFLEFIEDVIKEIETSPKPLKIIDFGCGKAYLTFALYDYLYRIKKISIQVLGLDLKADVIAYCQELAEKLNYSSLNFKQGSIEGHQEKENVDLVVCLHACDTATDAALAKAVKWQAQAILAVPCCQHEAYPQIQSLDSKILLKHGILKERIAALVTDAARAELLECSGYHTQIMEFIDLEHTPKNLLIKAIKRKDQKKKSLNEYHQFKKHWNVNLILESLLA